MTLILESFALRLSYEFLAGAVLPSVLLVESTAILLEAFANHLLPFLRKKGTGRERHRDCLNLSMMCSFNSTLRKTQTEEPFSVSKHTQDTSLKMSMG